MLISHRHRFIVFPDPLGSCQWIKPVLQPWLDQTIAPRRRSSSSTLLFDGMSPHEAELAFDFLDLPFRDYRRIAIIRSPYAKMAQLYYRIALTDPLWRARGSLGLPLPRFGKWLAQTRAHGLGAGGRTSPRWRRFGAWSVDAWCADCVTDAVQAANAVEELTQIFADIGIAPAFGERSFYDINRNRLGRLYDRSSIALIKQRYASDLKMGKFDQTFYRLGPPPIMRTQARYQAVA